MKKAFNLALALALFTVGMAVGRSGLAPGPAQADPASGAVETEGVQAAGSAGAALTWKQIDDALELTVTGSGAEFVGSAILRDRNAWPELGSAESQILNGRESFSLDLKNVEQLTFYRLEPVGSLVGTIFRPCAELPAGCFPVRPPVPPPWGPEDLVAVFANKS